jgi:2-polyprenyl-3-methyl-5-hydroxy-6-metoxy-1,4-benzoquinol methylase
MREFHKDKSRYFQIQYFSSREYIIPYMEDLIDMSKPIRVLEIGCAEAGVLKAFTERGDYCVGIELSEARTKKAMEFMSEELEKGQIRFLNADVYDINPDEEFDELFDLVILKDVIEHIHNQERFMPQLKKFLKPNGHVFFAFPPWYMPFGGHQQVAESKLLSVLPYYHILPRSWYAQILKWGGESEKKIEKLLEIWDTRISIERFERIVRQSGFDIAKRTYWFTNPIYQWKFNLKPRKLIRILSAIPFVRNFYTTAMYYAVRL